MTGVQSEIRRLTHNGKPCILKTPRHGVLRLISQWTLSREKRMYLKLSDIRGIPACLGMTADGLLLEAVDGRPLSDYRKGQISIAFLDDIDRLIADIHARGVAHSDLKKRDNILVVEPTPPPTAHGVGQEQIPFIIDFGAAFEKGHPLFETFKRIDLAAAAKLRAHHQPDSLKPEQHHLLVNPTWAERLSRFLIHSVRDPFRAVFGNK